MVVRTRLRLERASAAAARRFVADVLVNRGFPYGAIEGAVLVTSEVVTDAVLDGLSDIEVGVIADPSMARVEIRAGRSNGGLLLADGPDPEQGWRRRIVDTCCERWGVEVQENGTSVWFELRP